MLSNNPSPNGTLITSNETLKQIQNPSNALNTELGGHPTDLELPQPLRKSVSVDSYAYNHGHRPNPSPATRPEFSRNYATSSITQPTWDTVPTGRVRGGSLSYVQSRLRQTMDADGDRYDPPRVGTRYHELGISKTHEQTESKSCVSTSPMRTPSILESHTQASTLHMSRNASSPQGPDQSLHSSILRSRSSSVGYYPSQSSKKMMINTQMLPSISRNRDIILLVLGTRGCGKSTLIQMGLPNANLSEASVINESPRYIRRLAYVGIDKSVSQGSHSHVLQVIEGDILSTTTDLPHWPSHLPPIDAVILCYDSSSRASFQPIKCLLKGYRDMGLSVIVLHCKADRTNQEGVNPKEALAELNKYDTGLIQVSSIDTNLTSKMGQSIDYVSKAVLRQRGSKGIEEHRNPASPTIVKKRSLTSSPLVSQQVLPYVKSLDSSLSNTSLASPPDSSENQVGDGPLILDMQAEMAFTPVASIADLRMLSNEERPSTQVDGSSDEDGDHTEEEMVVQAAPIRLPTTNALNKNEVKSGQWSRLEELLDRLLFIAVSEEDSTFVSNFLLIYRRFTTPRTVLLAIQKRIRQLDHSSCDPMFACFAQMRICHLLETWIRYHPSDFAVKGTLGALRAVFNSVNSKSHLLHYGTEFLPFLEQLPTMKDEDSTWSVQAHMSDTDSEDYESDDDETRVDVGLDIAETDTLGVCAMSSSSKGIALFVDRKLNFPSTKALFSTSPTEQNPKHLLKDLVRLANEVLTYDSEDIAREITRQEVELFLKIKPRDWVRFTFKSSVDSVRDYNSMANHLADWVSNLILCYDQPRQRARQVEKFVEIALKIRRLNNYSGLRSFVAGINLAADDVTLEAFRMKSPEAAKNLMSWDVLLKQLRSHRAYRLALRNSKGGIIPALEVHMQDLIKANEGNPDKREGDPSLIHWGKYNLIARFVDTITQCQNQCRVSPNYKWTERRDIGELLQKRSLMSLEMQQSRLNVPEHSDHHLSSANHRDNGLRKLIFW